MTALELIKSLARRESLVLVIDDPEAKRILAAWQVYPHSVSDFIVGAKDDAIKAERRLWDEAADIDFTMLGRLAKVPETRVPEAFFRLRAAHLIWPGATISEYAVRLLRVEAAKAMRDWGIDPDPIIPDPSSPPPALGEPPKKTKEKKR